MSGVTDTQPMQNRGLDKVVAQLIKEDSLNDFRRRSVHRTPFVRPVYVQIRGESRRMLGFSKNISPVGIGLVLEDGLPERTVAVLYIHSLQNKKIQIRSELRWSQPFGDGWSLTGWSFIAQTNALVGDVR